MPIVRPIIFNGEMVRAILDERKTQTRRPVKHIPLLGEPLRWCAAAQAQEPGWVHIVGDYRRFSPYKIGNHLWVRETWGLAGHPERVVYRANPADDYQWGSGKPSQGDFKWRPSIHMPRWASRITLEVTGVRVERVQEITEEAAKTEGVDPWYPKHEELMKHIQLSGSYRNGFHALWDSLYPGSWKRNDWVWVIEFRRLSHGRETQS